MVPRPSTGQAENTSLVQSTNRPFPSPALTVHYYFHIDRAKVRLAPLTSFDEIQCPRSLYKSLTGGLC